MCGDRCAWWSVVVSSTCAKPSLGHLMPPLRTSKRQVVMCTQSVGEARCFTEGTRGVEFCKGGENGRELTE